MSDETKEDTWDKLMKAWWGKIIASVLMTFITYSQYVKFSEIESGERKLSMVNRTTRSLYNLGGKWGVVCVGAIIAIAMLVWGIKQLKTGKEE